MDEWLDEICYMKILLSMELKMVIGNGKFNEDGKLVIEKANGIICSKRG